MVVKKITLFKKDFYDILYFASVDALMLDFVLAGCLGPQVSVAT